MIKRNLGLAAFIMTGVGVVVSAAVKHKDLISIVFMAAVLCFFAIGLKDYIKEKEIK